MHLYLAHLIQFWETNVPNAYLVANSGLTVTPPNTWARRVLDLLEKATGELNYEADAALYALAEAMSVLRKQIDAGAAAAGLEGRGRLLAWQARKVRDYIDAHIAEPLRVADLGALIQRSEAHFSRSFKRTFGESPHAFLIQRRLKRAQQYMLQTDASLSEIALQCGFTDQAHLSRHFRQVTGSTPASWRRGRRASTDIASMESDLTMGDRTAGAPPPGANGLDRRAIVSPGPRARGSQPPPRGRQPGREYGSRA
jgi:AraC family transcriptional regulator